MVKNAISDYSSTAASNTDVGGVNIDEGMSPSGVNNAIRELMSHLADLNAGTSSLGTIKVDNLQLDANTISSTDTNGNINITPNGSGNVVIDGINYPQADGTANYFLKTDGAGQLSFAQVDTASIADDAIDGTKIADDAVASEHIADNSVGAAALNVSGVGTSGQFLLSDGDGTFSWGDAGGSTEWDFTPKTANFTAVAGKGYLLNTVGGSFTVTMPASPSAGDTVELIDYDGSFATNNLNVTFNGANFQYASSVTATYTNKFSHIVFIYLDSTIGWQVLEDDSASDKGLATTSMDYLVVAGGGGGSAGSYMGGGGAGGMLSATSAPFLRRNLITVTVGSGGEGGYGTNGSLSRISATGFTTVTANGGGTGNYGGASGGSGGGGYGANGSAGGNGTVGQGNNGGSGSGATSWAAGGGGGKGSAGGNASSGAGGNGGSGESNSITGSAVTYAGGGGGGIRSGYGSGGSAGSGGGGAGSGSGAGGLGTDGLGGGGGAASYANSEDGGTGGDGVVILRVPTSLYTGVTTGSPTVTTDGTDTVIKFTASGTYLP